MNSSRSYQKHRISYELNGVKFEIDTYPNIPTFLEIEAPSEEIIQDYVQRLGFTMDDAKPFSFGDIKKM